MANAKLWWHPAGRRSAVEIDLGPALTDLPEASDLLFTEAESLTGITQTLMLRSRLAVTIEVADFTSESLERDLLSLQAHLDEGGTIAVARDGAKAWGGYTARAYPSTSTVLYTGGNVWSSYSSAAALASGDQVVVWGGSPEGRREWSTVSSVSGSRITLATGLRYGYEQGPLLVRHRDFHPALRLAPDARGEPIVESVRRQRWTLRLRCVEDLAMLDAAATWGPGILAGTTDTGRGRSPLALDAANRLGLDRVRSSTRTGGRR